MRYIVIINNNDISHSCQVLAAGSYAERVSFVKKENCFPFSSVYLDIPSTVTVTEEPATEGHIAAQERTGGLLHHWLPIIVVILLGLAGALLSAFFFPTSKPGSYASYAPSRPDELSSVVMISHVVVGPHTTFPALPNG
jgi:hypothetical protein